MWLNGRGDPIGPQPLLHFNRRQGWSLTRFEAGVVFSANGSPWYTSNLQGMWALEVTWAVRGLEGSQEMALFSFHSISSSSLGQTTTTKASVCVSKRISKYEQRNLIYVFNSYIWKCFPTFPNNHVPFTQLTPPKNRPSIISSSFSPSLSSSSTC